MSIYDKAMEWIEVRRDQEQVINTFRCAADLKTLAYSQIVKAFADALRAGHIGWDHVCYYTIPGDKTK